MVQQRPSPCICAVWKPRYLERKQKISCSLSSVPREVNLRILGKLHGGSLAFCPHKPSLPLRLGFVLLPLHPINQPVVLQHRVEHWPHFFQKKIKSSYFFQWQMKQVFNVGASEQKCFLDLFRVKMHGIAVMKCKANWLKVRGVNLGFIFCYTKQNKPILAHRNTSLLFLNTE